MLRKVLIACRFSVSCYGVNSMLLELGCYTTMCQTEDEKEIISLVQKERPDYLVISTCIAGAKTPSCVAKLGRLFPLLKVICVFTEFNRQLVWRVWKEGINSILMATDKYTKLKEAFKEIIYSNKTYPPDELKDCLERKIKYGENLELTERELDVIKLIVKGKTCKEIAYDLFISIHTVNAHRQHIFDKLGVRSIAEVIIYAIEYEIAGARV